MIRLTANAVAPWIRDGMTELRHPLGGSVRIFSVRIPPDAVVPAGCLGATDLERASRFVDAREARYFLAGRAVLRMLLAAATGLRPAELVFSAGPAGKPRLIGAPIHFNVSRADSALLVAMSDVAEVGVDIELEREVPDVDALALEHLSTREYEGWVNAEAGAAHAAFLRCWTRKEACVKATGTGIAGRFSSIDAGASPGSSLHRLQIAHPGGAWDVDVASLELNYGAIGAAALAFPSS